jgi:hypothetical protein
MIYGRILRTAVLWSAGASLFGQHVNGPVLGYVWDSGSHQVRPLLGTPGAPRAGEPVQTAEPLAAAVSGKANFALVLIGESRAPALLRLEAAGTLHALPAVHSGAERVALSPGGTAAAFYFPGEKLIQIVAGLPDNPSQPVDVSLLPLRNPMAGFTVSDDGKILLCLEADGGVEAPAAVVLSAAGDLSRVVLSGGSPAAAFREGSHDALVATGGQLILLRDAGNGVPAPLGTSAIAVTAVAFSPDGGSAILADARSGRIAIQALNPQADAPALLECHCRPSGLFRLQGEAAWRLSEPSLAGVRILDLAGGRARLLTVPPPVESQ